MFHYTSCGLDGIYLRNGFTVKQTAYGDAVSIHNVETLHRAIGLHIVKHVRELRGAEIRFVRKELDMSQVDLADLIGVGESTIRNWERDRQPIAEPAARLLRLLYLSYLNEDSKISSMIHEISRLNRDIHLERIEFEECEAGWCEAA